MNTFRKCISISVFLAAFMLSATSQAADAFFDALEDLPIMDGLVENQAASVTFETATGRIVEVEASGGVRAQAVRMFYAEILPQLGWERIGNGVFERDQERLQLVVTDAGNDRVLAAFSLSPKTR